MKVLVTLNDAPYGSERVYNGRRLGNQFDNAALEKFARELTGRPVRIG